MRRRTISVFLSLMLCLSLLSACGTTTDVQTNGSNRDIAFEETQQEESAEGSDSTTSENGESASDPESGKDDSVSDKAQPSQPEQNANENSLSAEAPAFSLSAIAEYTDIYYAELNTGAFQNHFITFSENPKLVEIKGKDIYEKVRYCHQFNEVANTNIQRVFELILKTAVKNRVPQKDMPAKIFIISDMEFDYCTEDCSLTNFEYAQRLFEEHGYQLPEVMFWNVASRNQQQPVKINDQGVALVSGCNPRIFSMLKAGILSPYAFMMDVLGSERYAAIVA